METALDSSSWIANLILGEKDCYGKLYKEGGSFCSKCGTNRKCKELTLNKEVAVATTL